jgi:hypothetical protein
MPGRSYADFDLLIESGDGYRARVQKSPGGEGETTFRLPFSEAQIRKLLPRLAWSRRGRNLGRSRPALAADVKRFGAQLFGAVFTGEVGDCFHRSLAVADDPAQGLRLRLRLKDVPELAQLPWEYLYDEHRDYLGLAAETPIVRYPELSRPVPLLRVESPLRLLVVIANPQGTTPLDVEEEWRQIQEAVADLVSRGLLVVERLERPTLAALNRHLRRQPCHVLHFIGHGAYDRELSQGFLVFADEAGQAEKVSGQKLGSLLRGRRISLAVLNACEGARHGEADALAGVAQTLLQRQVPAVVAMQSEISDGAAVAFAGQFYQLLAEGFPLDGALSEARRAIFAAGHGVEWGTPVLYMRSPDGHLLATPGEPPPARQHALTAFLHLRWAWLVTALLVGGGIELGREFHGKNVPAPLVPASSECPAPPGTDIGFQLIPKGTFTMGSNKKSEKPSHTVTITKSFCLGQTEVTQRQWAQVMSGHANPRQQPRDELPVTDVSWDQAHQFIDKLNEAVGRRRFRLPTEAEWEYAARAGSVTRYSFGADRAGLSEYGHCKPSLLSPVHQLKPNQRGLYDMHGNVWEWVEDRYGDYSADPAVDPKGSTAGDARIRRGGSFESSYENCQSAARKAWPPGRGAKDLGFRIVEDLN